MLSQNLFYSLWRIRNKYCAIRFDPSLASQSFARYKVDISNKSGFGTLNGFERVIRPFQNPNLAISARWSSAAGLLNKHSGLVSALSEQFSRGSVKDFRIFGVTL